MMMAMSSVRVKIFALSAVSMIAFLNMHHTDDVLVMTGLLRSRAKEGMQEAGNVKLESSELQPENDPLGVTEDEGDAIDLSTTDAATEDVDHALGEEEDTLELSLTDNKQERESDEELEADQDTSEDDDAYDENADEGDDAFSKDAFEEDDSNDEDDDADGQEEEDVVLPNHTGAVDDPASTDNENGCPNQQSDLIVDIVTTGSVTQPKLLQAQRQTFATHVSVRKLFAVNEHNDTEKDCHTDLKFDDALDIIHFCRSGKAEGITDFMHELGDIFMRKYHIKQKKNPAGWVCAQKRPLDGLYIAMKEYKETGQLPDYLFITDDDTYLNMEVLLPYLTENYPVQEPSAVAGCQVRMVTTDFNLAYGGYGTYISRPAIENFLRPIYCEADNGDEFSRHACKRLAENLVGEAPSFEEGMNVAELMYTYTFDQPYLDHANWRTGFCMHSDTAIAFFVNYYVLPVVDGLSPSEGMKGYKNSTYFTHKFAPAFKKDRHMCNNDSDEHCPVDADFCHYVTADHMLKNHKALVETAPDRFRKPGSFADC